MGDKKRPKSNFNNSSTSKKDPKLSSNPDIYYDRNPNWRISRIELSDPYGWHNLDVVMVIYIKEKLSHFETMTWREILLDAKKQNHFISVDRLSKNAQDRLIETNQDDVEELLSLRLSGKERIWGVLEQGTLNLLWWDPNHQICLSTKKNT